MLLFKFNKNCIAFVRARFVLLLSLIHSMEDSELTRLAIKLLEKEGQQFVRQRSLGQARQGPLKTNKRFLSATLKNIECSNRRINQNIRKFQNKFVKNDNNQVVKDVTNNAEGLLNVDSKTSDTERFGAIKKKTKNDNLEKTFKNGRPNFVTFVISSSSEDELETEYLAHKNKTKFSLQNQYIKDKIIFNKFTKSDKTEGSSEKIKHQTVNDCEDGSLNKAMKIPELDNDVIIIKDSDSSSDCSSNKTY